VPEAIPLLRLMSCYACPTPIPRDILTSGRLVTLFGPEGGTHTRHKLERALEELGNHSLITFRQATDDKAARPDIVVHQVVAEANRECLRSDGGDNGSQAEAALIRRAAVDLIVYALDQLDPEDPRDWPSYFRLGPHLHALLWTVAKHLDTAGLLGLLRVTTTTALAHSLYGVVTEANRLSQAVLDRLDLIPEDDLIGAKIRHEVAWFLVMWRRPEEAQEMYSAVLRVRMSLLGPDDPETLRTCHELGWQAACEGLWAKAEEFYRSTLAARRRILGDLDPETLISRHELGWVIANQGRAEEAEAMLTDVLTHRKNVLGDDHPRTLWTRHELAWAIAFQGKWAEAETMYRDILKVRQRVLRIDHPDIFTTLHELAWVVSAQGRMDEARKLYAQVLTARLALFGPDSPDTAAMQEAIDGLGDGKAVKIMVPRHFA
jgi:tetratricopeptide (TPR) repeat protein